MASDDVAIVAGAIVLFAAEGILRSSKDLLGAYLEGMRTAIDNLVRGGLKKRREGKSASRDSN